MSEHDWHGKDLCEWDPVNNRPARYVDRPKPYLSYREGCTDKATLLVGSEGQWRLCDHCAGLKRFKGYRTRKEINHG